MNNCIYFKNLKKVNINGKRKSFGNGGSPFLLLSTKNVKIIKLDDIDNFKMNLDYSKAVN